MAGRDRFGESFDGPVRQEVSSERIGMDGVERGFRFTTLPVTAFNSDL